MNATKTRAAVLAITALAATAAYAVSNNYAHLFVESIFVVDTDYGDVSEMAAPEGRSVRLQNDASAAKAGAQISISNVEGDSYVFFDWIADEEDSSRENESYIRISTSSDEDVYFDSTFHDGSMEVDRNSFREYLKPGKTYTVEIGVRVADPASNTYALEVHNLKIGQYQPFGFESYTETDPSIDLLIAPIEVDSDRDTGTGPTSGTGTAPTHNPGSHPTGSGPTSDTGTAPTYDPESIRTSPETPQDTGDAPTTNPGSESTDSDPNPDNGSGPENNPGPEPTDNGPTSDNGSGPENNPGSEPTDNGPTSDNGSGPENNPGSEPIGNGPNLDDGNGPANGPGSESTDNGPTSDNGNEPENDPGDPFDPETELPIPGLFPNGPIFLPEGGTTPNNPLNNNTPLPGPFPDTGASPASTPSGNAVPDSSLGFLGIATLLGLLFAKALLSSEPNRRRDH